MPALNIRNIGDERIAALEAEARAQGVSMSELVCRFLDEGIERTRTVRGREKWLASTRKGLAIEADELRRKGPSLARYRKF